MREIRLVRVGDPDPDILEFLSLTLRDHFSADCLVLDQVVDLKGTFDVNRGQYHSTNLLGRLLDLAAPSDEVKILGITDVDLYIPILTFVFGEAQLKGRVALVSVYRLRQEFYGLQEDPELFYGRIEKESVHELGHTFGLVHCRTSDCVMRFSNSVDDVDLKGVDFCPECRHAIPSAAHP